MLVLLEPAQSELDIKNSRFISEIAIVRSQEEAREYLRNQKVRYSDATHVVHAFAVGSSGGTKGCSDDGEPSGTAGRPTLEVLGGSGITNIILTTTRYFGGIKLGTGGLVKAYTESAQLVLSKARTTELVPMSMFELKMPYACFELGRKALESSNAVIESEIFGEGVTWSGRVRTSCVESLRVQFRDMSRGKAEFESMEDSD